ncbi:MAG: hypothetical protein GX142_06485 [Chloroflexi bacterium]|nr:hypothetical protein [Chloroflexota bacterium]
MPEQNKPPLQVWKKSLWVRGILLVAMILLPLALYVSLRSSNTSAVVLTSAGIMLGMLMMVWLG